MDRQTFLETLNERNVPKDQWQEQMNSYRRFSGYFDDDKEKMFTKAPVAFKPNAILNYDPRKQLNEQELKLYNEFSTEEDEYKFIADQFLSAKYQRDITGGMSDIMIRKEMGLSDDEDINYGAFVTQAKFSYPPESDEWMVDPQERFIMRNPDQEPAFRAAKELTTAEKEKRFFNREVGKRVKSASSFLADYFGTSPVRSLMQIDSFKKEVLNNNIGTRKLNGKIERGSGGFLDAARFGYYGVNFNQQYNALWNAGRFEEADKLKAEYDEISGSVGSAFDYSEKNWFERAIKEGASTAVPMAETILVGALTKDKKTLARVLNIGYWANQGAGQVKSDVIGNRKLTEVNPNELSEINNISNTLSLPYAAVEFLFAAIPNVSSLGSTKLRELMRQATMKTFGEYGRKAVLARVGSTAVVNYFGERLEEGIQEFINTTSVELAKKADPEMEAVAETFKEFLKSDFKEAFAKGKEAFDESKYAVLFMGAGGTVVDLVQSNSEYKSIQNEREFLRDKRGFTDEKALETAIEKHGILGKDKQKNAMVLVKTEELVLQGVEQKEAERVAKGLSDAKTKEQTKSALLEFNKVILKSYVTRIKNQINSDLSEDLLTDFDIDTLAQQLVDSELETESTALAKELAIEAQKQIDASAKNLRIKLITETLAQAQMERGKAREYARQLEETTGEENEQLRRKISMELADLASEYQMPNTPYSKLGFLTEQDFKQLRETMTDKELEELIDMPLYQLPEKTEELFNVFIKAVNGDKEAQAEYNQTMQDARDVDYDKFLKAFNLVDAQFQPTQTVEDQAEQDIEGVMLTDEQREQILAGELAVEEVNEIASTRGISVEEARVLLIDLIETYGQQVDVDQETETEQEKAFRIEGINNIALNATKALSQVAPDVKIITHETTEEFVKAVGSENLEGIFISDVDGVPVININAEIARPETVAHEAFHALVSSLDIANIEDRLFEISERVKPYLEKDALAELETHLENYKDEDYAGEESLAKIVELLSKNYQALPQTEKNIIIRFLERLIEMLGLSDYSDAIFNLGFKTRKGIPKRDKQVINFLQNISVSLSEGIEIQQRDLNVLRPDLETLNKKDLVARAKELSVPSYGSKAQILQRIRDRYGKRTMRAAKISKIDDVYNDSRVGTARKPVAKNTDKTKSNVSLDRVTKINVLLDSLDKIVGEEKQTIQRDKDGKEVGRKSTWDSPIERVVELPSYLKDIKNPEEKLEAIINHLKDNLLALHDAYPEGDRDRATQWYDGARLIADDMASKYNITPEQSGAILALFSPQKDWYQNVQMALNFADVMQYYPDVKIDDNFNSEIEKIIEAGQNKKDKDNRRQLINLFKGKSINEIIKDPIVVQKTKKRGDVKEIVDQDISELLSGWAVRIISQQVHGQFYDIIAPEGFSIGLALDKEGSPRDLGWQGAATIGRAVRVWNDGSEKTISDSLGSGHKVRSFNNNIVAPNSSYGDVTMDTHAVAAAFLFPLSGSGYAVTQNLSGKAVGNDIKGTYPVLAEAYRRAANERNLQPRQMQSITWEAVRTLFTDVNKRNKLFLEEKAKILETQDAESARNSIISGGIGNPTWSGIESFDDRAGDRDEAEARESFKEAVNSSRSDLSSGVRVKRPRVKPLAPIDSVKDLSEIQNQDVGGINQKTDFENEGKTVRASKTKPPKKTVKAYKLFRLGKDGNLYPLFVRANEVIPEGEWVEAQMGTLTKDGRIKAERGLKTVAARGGFHAGDYVSATHIGGKAIVGNKKRNNKANYRKPDQVWAEIEMADDVDWQTEANNRAEKNKDGSIKVRTAHITDRVPNGGYYRYKTNPNMQGNWLIGGEMKVTKRLSLQERKQIMSETDIFDLPDLNELIENENLSFNDLSKTAQSDLKNFFPDLYEEMSKNPNKEMGVKTRASKRREEIPDDVIDIVKGFVVKIKQQGLVDRDLLKQRVSGTSLLRRDINATREAYFVEGEAQDEVQHFESVVQRVQKTYDQEGADQLVRSSMTKLKTDKKVYFEPDQVFVLALRKQQLERKILEVGRQADEAGMNGNTLLEQQKVDELNDLTGFLEDLLTVAQSMTSQFARGLRFVQLTSTKLDLYSLPRVLQTARKQKGEALTNEERKDLSDLSRKIKEFDKEIDDMNDIIIKSEDEDLRKSAEEFINTTGAKVRGFAKKRKEVIIKERNEILGRIRKMGFVVVEDSATVRMSKVDQPEYTAELRKEVAALAKNFIEDGVTELDDLISKIRTKLPEKSAYDIMNILSNRTPAKRKEVNNENKNRLIDLKRQARLRAEIQDLLNGVIKEKKLLKPDSSEVKKLKAQLKELRRTLIETDDKKADDIYDRIRRIEEGIEEAVSPRSNKREESERLKTARQDLRELQRLYKIEDQIKELQANLKLEGQDLKDLIPAKKTPKPIRNKKLEEKIKERAALQAELRDKIFNLQRKGFGYWYREIAGVPRAILATADMSYLLRQGLIVSAGHPVIASKAFAGAVKAFFSKGSARVIDNNIRSNDLHPNRIFYGLELSTMDGDLSQREEMFATSLLQKIPIIAASERHMVTGLNLLRVGLFDDFVKNHPDASEEAKFAYARYINVATGRGELGQFNGAAEALAGVFFSPRFAVSRIQAPAYAVKNVISQPELRKEMVRQWFALAGTGAVVLTLAAMNGADVGDDPEDTDFGKFVIGNRRYDIFGGLLQPMRLILLSLKATDGAYFNVFTDDKINKDIRNEFFKFFEYKFNPVLGILHKAMFKEDPLTHKEINWEEDWREQAWSFAPITVQTFKEALDEDYSAMEVASVSIPEFFGVGVGVYEKKSKRKKPKAPKYY